LKDLAVDVQVRDVLHTLSIDLIEKHI
jgi:hypothetical protein